MGDITETTTLITGGTGKIGRRIVERLEALGLPVRVGSRNAEPPFDWGDRSTWAPALRGVERVYLSYYPDLAVPGAVEMVDEFAKEAVRMGVRRIVLLSGRGEDGAEQSEEKVRASGAEWTILRSSWFSQNFSENYLLEPVMAGEVVLPVDVVREPFVDAEDVADVAVAALTEAGHAGELYELTGPRLLTFGEAVGEIAAATGRTIEYVPVTVDDYTAALKDMAVPDDFVWLLGYLFSEVLDGRNERLCDGVQRALGREPRDFTEYVRETAAAGVWE
jgi:uncharacterized protein YbjT (DUF2867 family)